jgi:POT family proton-dependent oligopeptide transporter
MSFIILLGAFITALTMIPVVMQLRRQPRGLVIVFFAETWERFSYYGMRALLIFYLTQHFLFDDKVAAGRYGAYTTLVALLPLAGGIIADRILGVRKAVAFGCLLLVAGHLTMAMEGRPAQNILTAHGHAYSVQTEGRASTRVVHLVVDGKPYAFKSQPDGALDIEGLPADASIPAHLAKSDYQISVVGRDAFHADLLFIALSLIVMGVAFLKTSPLVAQLYDRDDPRRAGGFTLYYYGVNLGAFWAGILCGWLGETIGWWAGFGAAAAGMITGYLVFVLGKPLLEGAGEPPNPALLARKVAGPINREHLIYAGAILGVGGVDLLLRQSAVIGGALFAVTVAALIYLGHYMARKCTAVERRRIGLAFVLMLGSVVFWTLFEQAGSSMSLFADRNTNLAIVSSPIQFSLLGHTVFLGTKAMLASAGLMPDQVWWIDMTMTSAQTQSINPGFILIGAPIFAALWAWLGRRRADPPPMFKFGLALVQVGAGFLFLVWGANFADGEYRVPLYFLTGAYLLHTTGELCLSPVGLAVVGPR